MKKKINAIYIYKLHLKTAIFLGVDIDKLNFEKHILNLYKKASKQFNVISIIQHYIGKKKKL